MVLLPTPPLPEPTAITLLAARPISPIFSAGRSCRTTFTVTSATCGSFALTIWASSCRVSFQSGAE